MQEKGIRRSRVFSSLPYGNDFITLLIACICFFSHSPFFEVNKYCVSKFLVLILRANNCGRPSLPHPLSSRVMKEEGIRLPRGGCDFFLIYSPSFLKEIHIASAAAFISLSPLDFDILHRETIGVHIMPIARRSTRTIEEMMLDLAVQRERLTPRAILVCFHRCRMATISYKLHELHGYVFLTAPLF